MKFEADVRVVWRAGGVPPSKLVDGKPVPVTPEEFDVCLGELAERGNGEDLPKALYEASRSSNHLLYHALWKDGDATWAERGRISHCRKLIGMLQRETIVTGGRVIITRQYESLRIEKRRKVIHLKISTIANDPALRRAMLDEIIRLQRQATTKLEAYLELLAEYDGQQAATEAAE